MSSPYTLLAPLFALLSLSRAGFCPSGCICNEELLSVVCENVGLKAIPILLNPRIRALDLRGNHIEMVGRDELSFYKDLELLDLSDNQIKSVERGAFFQLASLKSLNLAGNRLKSVAIDSFAGLAQLTVLDLSRNELNRVGTSVFSDLNALQLLNLSSNSVQRLAPDSLSGLLSLTELQLGDNELTDVPVRALRPLIELRILNLAVNRITTLDNESFIFLHRLEVLDLSFNRLDSLHSNSLMGLHNLRVLSIRANMLFRVPTMALRHLTELQVLDVSENQLQELATSSFDGLARLRRLTVDGCPLLHTVQMNAFSGLYSLETLEMSHNPSLVHISSLAFERPISDTDSGPRRLFLSHNGLRSLAAELVNWDKLVELDLAGNPWLCDCGVAWLPAVLHKLKGARQGEAEPSCAGPEPLVNKQLVELTSNDFAQCYDRQTTRMVIHLAALFSSLLTLTVLVLLVIKCIDKSPDCLYFACSRCCCCSPSASGARSLTASSDNDSASALYNGHATLRPYVYDTSAKTANTTTSTNASGCGNKSASLGSRADLVYSPAQYAAYQHQYCSTPMARGGGMEACQPTDLQQQQQQQHYEDAVLRRAAHPPPFMPPPPPPVEDLPAQQQQGGYYCSIPPPNGAGPNFVGQYPPYMCNGPNGRLAGNMQVGRSPSTDSANFRVLSKYPVPITEL